MAEQLWWLRDIPPLLNNPRAQGLSIGLSPGNPFEALATLHAAVHEAVLDARWFLFPTAAEPTEDAERHVRETWAFVDAALDAWVAGTGWHERYDVPKLLAPFGLLDPNPPQWSAEEWGVRWLLGHRFDLLERVMSEDAALRPRREELIAVLILHEAFEGAPEVAIRGGVALRLEVMKRELDKEGRVLARERALRQALENANATVMRDHATRAARAKADKHSTPLKKKALEIASEKRSKYRWRAEFVRNEVLPELKVLAFKLGVRPVKAQAVEDWLKDAGY